jgi:O-antigen/teichoic acid export membrane protein
MSKALYKNSIILLIGTVLVGFGGYLFQMIMGRMLSLADFGTLAALTSFFSFISVPASALTTITTRTVAGLKAQGALGAVHYFMVRLNNILFGVAALLFVFFVMLAPVIERWLRLESRTPYYWYCFSLFFIFMIAIYRGVLPGLQRFIAATLNGVLESMTKLLLAVALVLLSFRLSGAVASIVLASMAAFAVLVWQLRDIRRVPIQAISLRHIPRQYLFVILWSLALIALQGIDLLLVKQFFSPENAGLYAGVSILSKIIMFASLAVSSAMFPAATELYESGDHAKHRMLLWKALGIMVLVASAGLVVYGTVPQLVIYLLFGKRYVSFASYLFPLGVVASFLSVVQLFATYFLSIRKRFFLLPLLMASGVEAMLILRYHATVYQVITVALWVMGSTSAILLALFIRDGYGMKKPYDEQPQ